jgi:hypothetical protein
MVTESSRLDRREDLDAQAEILLAIRSAGGDVMSLAEPEFGKTDFAGRIVTLVIQQKNAEKSKEIRKTTYRGFMMIRDNKGYCGHLPMFWVTRGVRHARQAYCVNPVAVADIYERVAGGETLASIGRAYDVYAKSVKSLVRFPANHTGVIEVSYTYEGQAETWPHEVTPVVDSSLWWRANRVLELNMTEDRANRGGRPVARPGNWISGALNCPECGEKLYLDAGVTAAGNPRTAKLRCGGSGKYQISCRRFRGCEVQPVIDLLESMFADDETPILAFQRIAGNAHELDALKAGLRKIQARLSVTEDDDELDKLVAERKSVKARIEGFKVIPDSFDYAPTGQTVAGMWAGDHAVKRNIVKAVKDSWGLALSEHDGQWVIKIGAGFKDLSGAGGVVDLGNGLCFRREAA